MKTTKPIDVIVFDGVLLILFAGLAIVGTQYQPMARELPLPISIIGAVLVFILLLTDLFRPVNRALPFVYRKGIGTGGRTVNERQEHAGETVEGQQDGLAAREWLRILRLVCWLAMLVIAMQWIGYLAASGCFVFLVTWLEGRLKWWHSLISALGTVCFFYVIFNLFLSVTF